MTATESDMRDGGPGGGAGTVHCAVHNPGEDPEAGSDARPRVRTREGSGGSAQSQPGSAPDPGPDKHPETVTLSDRLGGVVSGFTPPDIWSQDRPALSKVWAYAARGDWTGPDGAPRRVGQLYALLVAVPAVAVAYTLAWAAERGTRLTALIVLLILLSQVPPLAWLI